MGHRLGVDVGPVAPGPGTPLLGFTPCWAQSPEISLREFASGQIKKGVRTIGFGGDGATTGNYALVWRDAGTALVDAGVTAYLNGNLFSFTAVAVTSPQLWRGLALYAIGLSQSVTGVHLRLSAPGLGTGPQDMVGEGANQAVFVKLAMPLPRGFAIGILLSYEVSQFSASSATLAPGTSVRYRTGWLPSGGLGVTWQVHPRVLTGVRVILNHDREERDEPAGLNQGLARSYEFRAGVAISLWKGALIDAGGTLLDRANSIAGTETVRGGANLGFEQAFLERTFVLRAGADECTFVAGCTITTGLSLKRSPANLDLAYLYKLGDVRLGDLFGTGSHSVLATLTLDYVALFSRQGASR